jgi:broad specificity phosphatase PhoE
MSQPSMNTPPPSAEPKRETLPAGSLAAEAGRSLIAPSAAPHGATSLWLIRHAEVEERYHNVFGGRIDMELSARGHDQARALARFLETKRVDALYASPMRRVQQTLAPLLLNGFPKPVVRPELREVDFGDWTGLHWTEVQERYGISALDWLDQIECAAIPQAESGPALRSRIEPCLRQILAQHSGGTIALACHGGVIRVCLSILVDLPLPKLAAFEIDYASLTQVLWKPPRVRLPVVNFLPWNSAGNALVDPRA